MERICEECDRLERNFIRPRQKRSLLLLRFSDKGSEVLLRALEGEEIAALSALVEHRLAHAL
jgi:hypothetical protein